MRSIKSAFNYASLLCTQMDELGPLSGRCRSTRNNFIIAVYCVESIWCISYYFKLTWVLDGEDLGHHLILARQGCVWMCIMLQSKRVYTLLSCLWHMTAVWQLGYQYFWTHLGEVFSTTCSHVLLLFIWIGGRILQSWRIKHNRTRSH